jgi:amino acid transporter
MVLMAPTFMAINIAIAGVVPWFGDDGIVARVKAGDPSAGFVMSTFCEILFGRPFAIFFTLVVVYTIFGSVFALLLGYTYIPYAAAKDRYFYSWFGHEHPTKRGLADYSLLFMGGVAAVLCFVDLGILIQGMLTTRLIVQYIGQAVGLVILRKKAPNAVRGFRVPLYPLPIIINILGFGFVFATTSNWVFYGQAPLLEVGILTLIVGSLLFLPFAKVNKFWPFLPNEPVVTVEAPAAAVVIQASALECALREDNGVTGVELTSLELDVTGQIEPSRRGTSFDFNEAHNSMSGLIQQKI